MAGRRPGSECPVEVLGSELRHLSWDPLPGPPSGTSVLLGSAGPGSQGCSCLPALRPSGAALTLAGPPGPTPTPTDSPLWPGASCNTRPQPSTQLGPGPAPSPGPHRDHMEDATRMALVRQVRQVSGGAGPVARQTDGMGHHSHPLEGHHKARVRVADPLGEARETGTSQQWGGLLV